MVLDSPLEQARWLAAAVHHRLGRLGTECRADPYR